MTSRHRANRSHSRVTGTRRRNSRYRTRLRVGNAQRQRRGRMSKGSVGDEIGTKASPMNFGDEDDVRQRTCSQNVAFSRTITRSTFRNSRQPARHRGRGHARVRNRRRVTFSERAHRVVAGIFIPERGEGRRGYILSFASCSCGTIKARSKSSRWHRRDEQPRTRCSTCAIVVKPRFAGTTFNSANLALNLRRSCSPSILFPLPPRSVSSSRFSSLSLQPSHSLSL